MIIAITVPVSPASRSPLKEKDRFRVSPIMMTAWSVMLKVEWVVVTG
ncbi:hypothetical protein [Sphingobacterium sp. JB170]|nr:hypothetical protein [Sphingobacterium sp. JB170]